MSRIRIGITSNFQLKTKYYRILSSISHQFQEIAQQALSNLSLYQDMTHIKKDVSFVLKAA